MKKIITIGFILSVSAFLTACSNNKTPNCFDETVAQEVGDKYRYGSELPYLNYGTEEHTVKGGNAVEYNTQIKNIEEMSYDKSNDSYVCKGKLILTPTTDPIYGGIMYDKRILSGDTYSTYYMAQMIQYDIIYYISGGKKMLNVGLEWKNREMFGTSIDGD